jgi:hypothetical protein
MFVNIDEDVDDACGNHIVNNCDDDTSGIYESTSLADFSEQPE